MSTINQVNFNDTTPAAPSGSINSKWQSDSSGGAISTYTPPATATTPGAVPTPPNDATKYLDGTGNWSVPPAPPTPSVIAPQTKFHSVSPVGVGSVGDPNTLTSYYLSTAGSTVQNSGATSAGDPCSIECLINGGSGAFAQVGETAFTSVYFAGLLALQAAVQLEQTTHTRCWIGVSSLNGSNLQTDTPGTAGGQFVGFRFSTNAGDTHWMMVTADGVTQTVTSTGVAPDTLLHQFRVVKVSGGYEFYIDGTLVATNTTHLPTGTVGASDLCQMDAPGSTTGTFGFRCAYLSWWDQI